MPLPDVSIKSSMTKSKKTKKIKTARKRAAPAARQPATLPEDRIVASDLSLHDLFAQSAATMLDRADLSDEQKQTILVGMSCPCCGAGGMSFTAKLKLAK